MNQQAKATRLKWSPGKDMGGRLLLRQIRTFIASRKLKRLEEARQIALKAWDDAKRRGDARDKHHTFAAYQAATHAVVRAEISMSRSSAPKRSGAKTGLGKVLFQ